MDSREATQKHTWTQSALYMDTVVTLQVVTSRSEQDARNQMSRAFAAFRAVENVCSRFQADSEVMQLIAHVGAAVPVSDILFEAIRFALAVADATDGAFDPTVGRKMEEHGFNRHYLSDHVQETSSVPAVPVSYQDVVLNEENRTVLLQKPLVLDLGAVAKGLAIDLAANELRSFEGFLVDAGGDLYAGGLNEQNQPWRVGIQHPEQPNQTIATLKITNAAVCTSGSYERISPVHPGTHHLIHPRTGHSRADLASCTVIAPFAMMADAFSTAAFIQGRAQGLATLEEAGLDGLMISSSFDIDMTTNMRGYLR